METQNNMTLDTAIRHHQGMAEAKLVSSHEHKKVAEWLQKLAAYEDKTYITADWLVKNEFEKREYDYLYCDDVVEISAQCTDTEAGTWHVYVNWLDSYNPQSLDIYTLGEFRMFLGICGLNEIVNEFKA